MTRTERSDINEEQEVEEMRVNGQLFQDALGWALLLDGTRKLSNGDMLGSLRRLFLGDDKHTSNDGGEDSDDSDNEERFRETAKLLGCAFFLCKFEHPPPTRSTCKNDGMQSLP